jgi:hypothetical protein
MINFCRPFSRPRLSRMLSRALVVGALATAGLLCGLTPNLSERSSTLVFSSAAYAQDVTNEEVTNYAKAALDIEKIRQQAHDEIKKIIGSEPPPIVCDKPESLNALTGDAHKIAVDYCKRSEDLVKSNHLTIARFNAITVDKQSAPNLKKRIDDELIRLPHPSPSP